MSERAKTAAIKTIEARDIFFKGNLLKEGLSAFRAAGRYLTPASGGGQDGFAPRA
jgi:hypothetical protein